MQSLLFFLLELWKMGTKVKKDFNFGSIPVFCRLICKFKRFPRWVGPTLQKKPSHQSKSMWVGYGPKCESIQYGESAFHSHLSFFTILQQVTVVLCSLSHFSSSALYSLRIWDTKYSFEIERVIITSTTGQQTSSQRARTPSYMAVSLPSNTWRSRLITVNLASTVTFPSLH